MWTVKDINLFNPNGQLGKEHAKKMFPDAEFESYHEAREEAMRRSFINSMTPSDIVNLAGEVVASALDGWCRTDLS